jgi:hypothetical protein
MKDHYEKMLNCRQIENTQEHVCQKIPLTINEELMPLYIFCSGVLILVMIFWGIQKFT